MFEEICLHCGKPLHDDGSAYCSEDCSQSAIASPSISSSGSELSSPAFGFAQGGDVPPLVLPSMLGSALGKYKRDSYYVSSSSASSNSWGLPDDDDDESAFSLERGLSYRDGTDSIYDGSSKSATLHYPILPSAALSYARRPSGTNTHSTVPLVHKRSSSGSSPAPVSRHRTRGAPRSVPNPSQSSSTDDSEDFSDSSRDIDSVDFPSPRRPRKRDNLPSYFNLLRINSSSTEAMKALPVLSSSGNTVARLSPPTPKNAYPSPIPSVQNFDSPRGRRRQVDESRCSRRSGESSPSRSRSRHIPVLAESPRAIRSREHAFEVEEPRGRATRRNSSPSRNLMGAEDPIRAQSNCSSRTRGRGRVPVEELEGVGCFPLAPGYGNGRSGLMDRGRMGALAKRVPL
ncbi:hypothetical protein D9611_004876 [Ephemerocybe angulata]|uniref:Uncharacterized protein n=2 Tax=Ephemerocybe angulata TaxID=980116 RepID=A0A8H6IFC0_9AGAR|nr:hypothetical protein D9611_004876 [Tulosesus angulatus]KAF6763959.1 hypothetical protein DFP72DRAFT_488335 [Tulosesus angulatus]